MGWVYGIQSGSFIKVGVAVDIRARMQTFRLHNPHQLKLVLKRQVDEPFWIEARMHRILAEYAIGREWFRCAVIDVKEAFAVASEDMAVHRVEQEALQRRLADREARRNVEKPREMGIERGMVQSI